MWNKFDKKIKSRKKCGEQIKRQNNSKLEAVYCNNIVKITSIRSVRFLPQYICIDSLSVRLLAIECISLRFLALTVFRVSGCCLSIQIIIRKCMHILHRHVFGVLLSETGDRKTHSDSKCDIVFNMPYRIEYEEKALRALDIRILFIGRTAV